MTKFLKLDDTNQESSNKVQYSFWAQLINTGFILLILNGVIFANQSDGSGELSLLRLAELIGFLQEGDTESFPDYNWEWFSEIGIKIVVTLMVYMFNPHCT
jgi:hypothetical protein